MRRRALLAGLSVGVGSLAGCNTTDGSTEPESSEPEEGTGEEPEEEAEPTIDSTFDGVSVPELPGEGGVTWYHRADESTRGFARPSTETTELPARVEFTYHNRSEESTSCGHWNLYKLRDDRWFHVGPGAHDGDCRSVAPGETKTWTMAAATGEVDDGEDKEYPYLGGGRYAAVAGYGHATSESAALVEFDAPPVSVEPTDDATSESDGTAVTVTEERWRTAADSDGEERATLTLERAQTADRTLIAEQVMRHPNRGYQNLLAFMSEDIERVVLRTDERTADWIVDDDETKRIRYDGQAYGVTKGEPREESEP